MEQKTEAQTETQAEGWDLTAEMCVPPPQLPGSSWGHITPPPAMTPNAC